MFGGTRCEFVAIGILHPGGELIHHLAIGVIKPANTGLEHAPDRFWSALSGADGGGLSWRTHGNLPARLY